MLLTLLLEKNRTPERVAILSFNYMHLWSATIPTPATFSAGEDWQ